MNINVHLKGKIEDFKLDSNKKLNVHVDFANKNVGFGTTGTQEELLLGFSPETCVVVLFNETLNDNDALLIQGAKIYGDYEFKNFEFKFLGKNNTDCNWSKRKIIAIDAYHFQPLCKSLFEQSSSKILTREIFKAVAGFKLVKGETVNTGNWGCGIFGGDKYIKSLYQIMAANIASVTLEIYTFNDEKYYLELKKVIENFKQHKTTVFDVLKLIKLYHKNPISNNILEYINKSFES